MICYTHQSAEGAKVVERVLQSCGVPYVTRRHTVRERKWLAFVHQPILSEVVYRKLIAVRSEDVPAIRVAELIAGVRDVQWERVDRVTPDGDCAYRTADGRIRGIVLGKKVEFAAPGGS